MTYSHAVPLKVLWIDLRCNREENSRSLEAFNRYAQTRLLNRLENESLRDKKLSGWDLLAFEFDFPDIAGLNVLKATRENFPQIPVLMLSESCTLELSLWALRLRVWDLCSTPVTNGDVRRLIQTAKASLEQRRKGRSIFDAQSADVTVPDEFRTRTHREPLFERIRQYIDQHCGQKLSEQELAAQFGLGHFAFSRGFKKHFGCTFQQYLVRQRIANALRLLANPKLSVLEVAQLSGFNDTSYFTRVFKRQTGVTPSAYRAAQASPATPAAPVDFEDARLPLTPRRLDPPALRPAKAPAGTTQRPG